MLKLRSETALALMLATLSGAVPGAAAATDSIIVTAQKTEQSIIDVPVTMTAISGEQLERIGVSEFDELAQFVPGLQVQEQSVNNPGFVIRGITSDDGSAQIAARVSVYQDGIDISRSRGSIVELFDLERVEVLKGPQATLFGSAASIGAIHVISARPMDAFHGKVTVGYGNYDEMRTDGFVTGPIIEGRLLGRVAWSYKKRDGYVENIDGASFSQNPQAEQAPALNGTDTFAGRVFLRFLPSDAMTADVIFNYQRDTPPGSSFKSGTLAPTGGATDPFSYAELGPFGATESAFLGGDLGIDREVWGVTFDVNYAINDAWSLNWISNYRTFDSLEVFDADGSPAYWLEFAEDADGEQWSSEMRVNYDNGGALRGFIGASFFWEDGTQRVPFETDEATFAACLAGFCRAPNGTYLAIDFNPASPSFMFPVPRALAPDIIHQEVFANTARNKTFSVYADASYDITGWLELRAGVRYQHESRLSGFMSDWSPALLTGASLLPIGFTDGEFLFGQKESFDAVLPRFNLKARLSETANAYVSVGKGRRSPVVNVQGDTTAPGAIVTDVLPSEIIWNYEAGIKGTSASGRIQYDAAIFFQDYDNFQTTVIEDGLQVPVNAGTATAWGWEASVIGRPAEFLDLFFNVGYTDAKFEDEDSAGNPQLFAGNRFRLQPKWTASAGFSAFRPVGNLGEIFFTGTWTFRSRVFFENENTPKAGLDIAEDSVSLVNLSAGLRAIDDMWQVEAYVKNVFNRRYLIDAGNTGGNPLFNTPTFIAGAPRFYGVALTGRF